MNADNKNISDRRDFISGNSFLIFGKYVDILSVNLIKIHSRIHCGKLAALHEYLILKYDLAMLRLKLLLS